MAQRQQENGYNLGPKQRPHQPPRGDGGRVILDQPKRSEQTSGHPQGSRNSPDVEDWDYVDSDEIKADSPVVVGESDTEQPSEDKEIEKSRATKEQIGGKDDGLCRQASRNWPTESGEFQSARSTPYSSMTSETDTHKPSTPMAEQQEREMGDAMFSHPEGLPNSVCELQQLLSQQSIRFQKAEKRARYFEAEYHEATRNLIQLKRDLQEKDKTMKGELEKTDAKMKSIQRHSKSQSQQVLVLHNEAKERDAEIHEVRLAMKKLKGKIETLEGEREAKDLELEQSRKTLQSLREQVKKLTTENASLLDRMRKFGGLQNESRELSTKVGKLQEELKKVSAERDELKFLLEATQAQAKVYEEDFKTEREDRTRAFAEREKEGERYREEIERLRIQLKSHKGNLTDLEIIHLARQRELMQAMDDLKKCQEEVQAKTSQVKQYKKQHDGLVTKVATLEHEKKELAEQFEMARQEVEQLSKKKTKAAHAEGEQAHAELAKQAHHYRAKSQVRKAELTKMTTAYAKARQELLNVKKEVKKEKKKTAVISNPVNQHELCRNLQLENEELKDQIKALMETNQKLNDSVSALEDADTGSVGSPTELEFPLSPDDEAPNSLAVASEVSTRVPSTTKSTGSRPRSSTFSGISPSPKPTGGKKPTPHYSNVPGATTSVRTDIQHADYVNQSRIQAMLANRKQSDAVPSSPPDANSLPAPIMVFTEDSANQRGSKPSPVPGSVPPSGASGVGSGVGGGLGGVGVEGQGRERRGSAPTWGSNDPDNLPALHERRHQLQSNPYGHTSLPESQMNRRPVPTPRKDQPASQPRPLAGPTPAEREMMMKQEAQRQAGDILTPGIATEMHGMAHDVIEEMEEGGHEVTGTPYDPNLTCIICQRIFRIGEIQLYRTHTETCAGTMV